MNWIAILIVMLPMWAAGQNMGRYPNAVTPTAESGYTWSGLDHWWSLDEASGTIIDSAGSDNGTGYDITYQATGKVNYGIDFESVDDSRINLTSGFNYGANDFAVVAWVKVESYPTYIDIVGGDVGSFTFRINTTGALSIRKHDVSESTKTSITLTTGSWYMIGVSYDQSEDELIFRINENSETESWDYEFEAVTDWIGGSGSHGTVASYDGILDNISVWDHVLTNDEWNILYNSGDGRPYSYE
jgi:hypothetical protein